MKGSSGHHWRDYADAIEALSLLIVARPVCRFASLRRIETLLPRPRGAPHKEGIERVVRAVERAAMRLPGRVTCFPRALCAAVMLRRRGHRSHLEFGLHLDADRLNGHVTANIGSLTVIGGEEAIGYTAVRRLGGEKQDPS